MLNPGDKLSHYTIISVLGSGGMGEVYLAEDTRLDRQVALKVLLEDVAGDEDRVRRFVQEAKASSALNHPNILTVYEIGEADHSQYIATELIKGQTLRDRMTSGPLSLGESLEIILQVTAALGAAHEAGIIHRDIKPENIMVRDDGLAKVLDFGLAKLTEPERVTTSSEDPTRAQVNTQPGMLMGTVAYMSPEQARGRKLDPRSDIFSLGIVMFELFTGKRPFDGEGHLDLISSILKDDAPSLRQIAPDLPRQLERIVDKTLRKDRDNRYQHVRDLYIDIQDLRDELKVEESLNRNLETSRLKSPNVITEARDPRPTLTASISTTRRFTLLHALIFALIAASLVGAAWFFRAGSGPRSAAPGTYKITEVATWNSAPGEIASNASFSPDGKLIAFSSTKSGTKNIWVTQTTSTDAIQITNDAFANTDPIWSQKRDEIAYFSDRSNSTGGTTNPTGIWRVPALGGTPRLVGLTTSKNIELRRWTMSGKIYYQTNRNELYAMDTASGTSQKVALPDEANIFWADISDDEKSLALGTKTDGTGRIVMSDITGGRRVEAAKGLVSVDNSVVWLPEKKRFFYGALTDGVMQIFMSEAGSDKGIQLTLSETDSSVVDAAPDGRSVILSSAKEESNLWRVGVTDTQEWPVVRDLNTKLWPAISPDDEKVAYQSIRNFRGGNRLFDGEILARSLKTRDESERATSLSPTGFFPTWAPDSSSLAFMRKNGDAVELYSTNVNGGGEKRLTAGGIPFIGYSISPYNSVQARAFAWSPDSSRIAYVSDRNGATNIWTVGLRDSNDTALTNNADADLAFSSPIWSVDGKRLAFYFQTRTPDANGKVNRGLKLYDTLTGQLTNVLESDKPIRLIGWAPDETGLVFAESEVSSGLPPATLIKRAAISDGKENLISDLKNVYFYNIFLSDDKKLIAYAARNDNKDDIWVISSGGGQARKLTSNNDSGLYFSRLTWLHDGSSIVFGKQTRYSLLSIITDIN